jgi:hypothetical protein
MRSEEGWNPIQKKLQDFLAPCFETGRYNMGGSSEFSQIFTKSGFQRATRALAIGQGPLGRGQELIPARAGLRSIWPDIRVLAKRATWLIATFNRQRQPGRGSPITRKTAAGYVAVSSLFLRRWHKRLRSLSNGDAGVHMERSCCCVTVGVTWHLLGRKNQRSVREFPAWIFSGWWWMSVPAYQQCWLASACVSPLI